MIVCVLMQKPKLTFQAAAATLSLVKLPFAIHGETQSYRSPSADPLQSMGRRKAVALCLLTRLQFVGRQMLSLSVC